MLTILRLEVTPFFQNARVVYDTEGGGAVVIDPGGEANRILQTLKEHNLTCEQIWLTHSHLDHCGGVKAVKDASGAKLYAHPDERAMRTGVREICRMYGLSPGDMENCPEPEEYLRGGEELSFGSHSFQVLFTPGHSPGHLSFYNAENNLLLSGDVLFAGAIGRTDLPGGDYRTLMGSIHRLIEQLPPQTRVLTGHGPDTTLEAEARSNPFLVGALV